MSIKMKDVFVVGFALFAMFFGAGNLIFPPYLGVQAGPQWFISFIAFLFADGGLSLLGVIALTKTDGDMEALFSRAGRKLGICLGSIMMICIGPLLAVPRTAATTYEVGILPTIGPGFNQILFSIIFFIIVLVLTIRPSKVVDIVGAFLTPALLVCLAILIIKGIVNPLGQIADRVLIDNVFVSGINDGYQTMDSMAACIFASIIITSIKSKGYEGQNMIKATIMAGIVAVIGMALVYGGLAYLGATVNTLYGTDVDRTKLTVDITHMILGDTGKVILGVIIGLACLTTAIGVSSACGKFFEETSRGKIKYEYTVTVVCVFATIISNFGVNQILNIAAPILGAIYPAVVVYIFMGLFNNKIKNNNMFIFGVWSALIVGILAVLPTLKMFANVGILKSIGSLLNSLPGNQIGFFWLIPVILFIIIGHFVPDKKKASV